MLDICMCADEECVHYNDCLRGGAIRRCGVYTSSHLSEICNEENNYELLITKEDCI